MTSTAYPHQTSEPVPMPAGWVRRAFAYLLDLVFGAIAAFVFLIVIAIAQGGDLHVEDGAFFGLLLAFMFAWEAFWLVGPADAKPGQLAVGMRVIGVDGTAVTVKQALVRTAVKVVSLGIGVVFILSAITIAASSRRQAIHDMVAGTMVVRPRGPKPPTRSGGSLATLGAPTGVPGQPGLPGTPAQPPARPASTIDSPAMPQRTTEERHRGPFL